MRRCTLIVLLLTVVLCVTILGLSTTVNGPKWNYWSELIDIEKIFNATENFTSFLHPPPPTVASPPINMTELRILRERRESILQEFRDCWFAYKEYAWGHYELRPKSRRAHDWTTYPLPMTAVDSLSTLWIMGMKDEFAEAVALVANVSLWQNCPEDVSAFEFNIRVVGGLLSAYELSGEKYPELLRTAKTVTDLLLPVFHTPSGFPTLMINLKNGKHHGDASLGDYGTFALEFLALSYHTRNPVYEKLVKHIGDTLLKECASSGQLCPGPKRGDSFFALGGMHDSYYEYLIKQYILTGQKEERYGNASVTMLDSILDRLLRFTPQEKLMYVTDSHNSPGVEHLTCFVGGMYVLGVQTFPHHRRVGEYRAAAEGLTEGCIATYDRMPTGVGPESVVYPTTNDSSGEDRITASLTKYILRPETVESVFYMWRLTKDSKWQDAAWRIFTNIKTACKQNETGGYSGIMDVTRVPPQPDDLQQSFFLAETLKYLYLTFAEDALLPLDQWVFNTEAHPLRIRTGPTVYSTEAVTSDTVYTSAPA